MTSSYKMARQAGAFGAEEEIAHLRALLKETGEALRAARSYYITDHRLGLDPEANAQVREFSQLLAKLRAAGVVED